MTWSHPEWLWLLLALPALAAAWLWSDSRRKQATAVFGNTATLGSLIIGEGSWWRRARAILLLIAVGLAVVAFAGPQYGSRTRVLQKQGIDIVIALDFSKSMLAQDVHPSRIDRAKAEILALLEELDGDRVGLVAFAGETIEFPMTVDYSAVRLFLRDLGPQDMPVGGTAIGRALIASKRLLERSARGDEKGESDPNTRRSQVVVLFTDGEDHEGDPVEAANELAEASIQVFTVGIGSRIGEPVPSFAADGTLIGHIKDSSGKLVLSALTAENEATLGEVAEVTDGKYIRAPEGTVGIDQIRREFSTLEKTEQKARRITVHENRFVLALLPAFLLLFLESLLPEAWILRRRETS